MKFNPSTMSHGKFHIKPDARGEHRFNLVSGNGEVVLSSEGYAMHASCVKGIESVRRHAPDIANYERTISASGKYHFNLKAKNGEVIGTSQMYNNSESMEKGIAAVMRAAPVAYVIAP